MVWLGLCHINHHHHHHYHHNHHHVTLSERISLTLSHHTSLLTIAASRISTELLYVGSRIWFGWVLWHINHFRLFIGKSFFIYIHIYIKYIGFGLVGFLWHVNHCGLFNVKFSLYICIKCYIVIYAFIQHHNDTIIKTHEGRKTQEDFFRKIFTSHFIARVRKGSMWEDAGDRT